MSNYVNTLTFTLFIIDICCRFTAGQDHMPATYSLLSICGQTISISEDMILTLLVNDTNKEPRHCQTCIESDVNNNRLLIQVWHIGIPHSPGCNNTNVRITGTEGRHEAGTLCGYNVTTPVFNTSGQSVHVQYQSSGHVHDTLNASLELLITSFHTQTDGSCDSYEFSCSNSLCIDEDLACNGYNDCSDNSDETIGCRQNNDNSKHILEIVTLSIVGCIFLITVTVVCYVKIRRARAARGKYLPID